MCPVCDSISFVGSLCHVLFILLKKLLLSPLSSEKAALLEVPEIEEPINITLFFHSDRALGQA